MDTRKIRKLIELVKETGIGELEVKSGEESVRISCQAPDTKGQTPAKQQLTTTAAQELPPSSAAFPTVPAAKPTAEPSTTPEGHTLKSPMVGTVYLAAKPGSPPFVSVGQHVKEGDTLCLIEAMKMFNKIEADVSGVISARLIENGAPVEYDQPLFIIDIGE